MAHLLQHGAWLHLALNATGSEHPLPTLISCHLHLSSVPF